MPSPGEAPRFFDADAKVPKRQCAGTFYFVRAWRGTCVRACLGTSLEFYDAFFYNS